METSSVFKSDACKSRVALVTGGGSGIGLGISRRLGQHGASLVLFGRREEFLKNAQTTLRNEGINVEIFAGDVRSEESAKQAVEFTIKKFGKLDTVINCAAGNFLSLAENLSTKGFRTVVEIDLIGSFNICRASFEALKASGNGSISKLSYSFRVFLINLLKKNLVNITATFHYSAEWYQTHASAAKAGIDSLTRQLALEWGEYGIRVNGVAPGPIAETPGLTKLIGKVDSQKDYVNSKVPLGRLGTTTEIGDSCVFLCSKAASYISGHTLVVDGASWLYSDPRFPRSEVTRISRAVENESRSIGGAKL